MPRAVKLIIPHFGIRIGILALLIETLKLEISQQPHLLQNRLRESKRLNHRVKNTNEFIGKIDRRRERWKKDQEVGDGRDGRI